jgi:hypothetical protein
MQWIVIVSMTAALAARGLAATDAQCSGILQRALAASNPETRKDAVVALSLASERGPLFVQLVQMLQDKDVEVRVKRCGPAMTPLAGPRCCRFLQRKARAHPISSPKRNAMPCA